MNPANLASKLADAISEVVPQKFRVYEEQGMVFIDGGRYRAASEVAETIDAGGEMTELAATVSVGALSMVQDYIAEQLTTPWPATRSPMTQPKVHVTRDEIYLWFQDQDGTRVLEAPVISW